MGEIVWWEMGEIYEKSNGIFRALFCVFLHFSRLFSMNQHWVS